MVNVTVGPDGSSGVERKSVVDDPDQTYKKIRHLDPNTTYSMTIVAQTDAGPGPEITVTASTVPVSGTTSGYSEGDAWGLSPHLSFSAPYLSV